MFFVVRSNDRFNFPLGRIKYIVIVILIEVLSRAHAKWGKSLNDFQFGIFTGRFPGDGAASMTMKGLKLVL